MQKEKYFVIGFRRYKTAEEFKNKVVGHNHRQRHYTKSYSNIDWSKTDKNIILTDLQFNNLNELLDFAKQNLGKGKRQLKKGAAWGFEIVVDCTPNENWTNDDYVRYLKDAEQYFKERFKGLKVISSVIHMDESKPHLHIVFSYFNELEGRWYQRKLKEKKLDRLKDILKDFEKKVGVKYGLYKGKGKELDKPIKKALAKAVEKVEMKNGFLGTETKKVINIPKALEAIKELDNKVKKIAKDAEYYQELENKYKELQRENKKLLEEKEELKERLLKLEQKAMQLKKENEFLKKENKELKQKNIVLVENYNKALEIAAREIHKRTSRDNSVNERMLGVTIKGIKRDNDLTI